MRKLYLEVAKTLHPDLTIDEEDRACRQSFMAEANRAYFEERDETRLEAILHEWESSPGSVKGDGVAAELVRVIRKINQVEERLNVIKAEIDQLGKSAVYQMKMKAQEAESEGRDLLKEMATDLEEQIALAKQELKKMKAKRNRWS